ncbi:MAG: sugar-binding domain-containing protein [Chitinophagaceae bacterium]
MKEHLTTFLLFLLLSLRIMGQSSISLAGSWRFQTDPNDEGITGKWYSKKLNDQVQLPGSMLTNGKGDEVTLKTKWTGSIYDSSWFFNPRYAKYRQPGNLKFPFWLTPEKYYVGAAWYQKEIVIPANWKAQNIHLFMERCHTETTAWLDNIKIGTKNSMVAPHDYELGDMAPGRHTITVRIDNRIKDINVGPDSHSLTDHTQGNWNGIVGKIVLNCFPKAQLKNIQVYPNVTTRSVLVKGLLGGNPSLIKNITITAKAFNNTKADLQKAATLTIQKSGLGADSFSINLPLGKDALLWDEFDPALYRLTVVLSTIDGKEQHLATQFGLRDFTVQGTQFRINGRATFLRGTVENCVFPLTGYASMDTREWERIFRICRSYGLNHMRFHSYCPPEAAFDAADRVGFYLQPEGPSWANHGSSLGDGKPIDQFIFDETDRMMDAYGNHPSYCMLAYGNEPRGGHQAEYLARFIAYWKQKDNRRVNTGASVAMSWPLVPSNEYMIKSGARNLAWGKLPESTTDYTAAIEKFTMPYVAHEMGQWCVYPNFSQIKKYTGPYKAKNFELFQEDLKDQGMGEEAEKFVMSSGYLQTLCYKNEIEKSLRTPGNGGFQLLSLNDYPGQGTALVGVLDAFWDEKGYVGAKQFSNFCNSTVPLLRLPKFVFTDKDTIKGEVEIYHFGKTDFNNATINWKAINETGKMVYEGQFRNKQILTGKNTPVGTFSFEAKNFTKPTKLNIQISIEGTSYKNDWNVWVYPAVAETAKLKSFYATDTLDARAEKVLAEGGKILLLAAGKVVKGKEISQSFTPIFWNTSWFKMRPPHTMGFLVDNKSAAFSIFPTDTHPDLQWWDVISKAQVMHLEDFPAGFIPLIQPIDTWFMNRRLAMLFEVKVGKGKLLVTSLDLGTNLSSRPAARQLLSSLESYLDSPAFDPKTSVDLQTVRDIFHSPSKYVFDAYTKDSPDELKPQPPIKSL